MITAKKSPFEQAIGFLGGLKSKSCFIELPRRITDNVQELRLRTGQPVTLECPDERIRIGASVTAEELAECVREFCGYSVHSCEKQFREGWLTLAGGHRAGFCGTAVIKNNEVDTIRNISSVNLRIARQFIGCANELSSRMDGSVSGLLIIGKPMSAKTTVLRDLCRTLSERHKIALIDERGELAAVYEGKASLDVGDNTDILDNFPKAQGIMTALRNLSPEFIICDEIGWETEELISCANSGVRIVMTAHCSSVGEAYTSRRIQSLLAYGGITHIALLGHGKNIGKIEFYGTNKYIENNHSSNFNNIGNNGGALFFIPSENAGREASGTNANRIANSTFD
ncbi:MAG: hypothetical protein FWD34_05170 [Oscillospiraceae bacterium]|nr:hypothetical protein [Oscillospiraceae bacterium]